METIFKAEILTAVAKKEVLNVAVHNGVFHSDDVFSVALLRRLTKECGTTLNVVRTRDAKELEKADMRVDVGGKYNEATLDFDHHQNDPELLQPEGIKYAAIGLLSKWCLKPEFLVLFREKYLLGLEHQDNTGKPHPQYSSIGFMVQPFVPAYGEKPDFDAHFEAAVEVAEIVLDRCIKTVEGQLQSEADFPSTVEESLNDGKVVVLKHWLPITHSLHPELAFTIVPVPAGYSIVGINGHLLKQDVWGLNGEQIKQACGYDGVFVHKGGFTATMKTLEGAKTLCLQSL